MDFGKLLGGLDPEKLKDVVDLVWNNREQLSSALDMVNDLPDMLNGFADGLGEAGTQAKKAGTALVGNDGKSGAVAKLGRGAESLGSLADRVSAIAESIGDAAAEVTKVPLMDGPAAKLSSAATSLSGTTKDLGGLADDLGGLAEILALVGAAMGELGDRLDSSGTQARNFAAKA